MILTNTNIKYVNLDDLVNSKIQNSLLNELLLIVPTNRKLRRLKKEIINHTFLRSAHTIHLETLSTFTEKLLKLSKPFKTLSEAASTVLISQSAEEIGLEYFSVYKNEIPFGTLDRIKNVISEYKRQGVTPQKLIDEADKLNGSEKLKAIDISKIYNLYKKKCHSFSAYEIGDIYEELILLGKNNFLKNFEKLYPSVNLIVINGFDEFSGLEIELLEYLSSVPNIKVFINFDYYEYNPMLFAHLNECYNSLERKGFRIVKDKLPLPVNNFNKKVREHLFSNAELKIAENYQDKISLIAADTRVDEAELIAKEIKSLILSKNISPSKICVSFNLVSNFSSIYKDIFQTYGIPFNLTDRTALDKSSPVISVISFLEILENDFYYKNIFKANSSGFVELKGVDLNNLMNIATQLKVIAGRSNWVRSITESIELLKYSEEIEVVDKKKISFEKALNDINRIYDLLKPFDIEITIPEFLENLKKLVFNLRLFNKILDSELGTEEANIKSVTTFFETITEIFNLLEQQFGKDRRYDLKFFLDQIRTASNWARFNVKEKVDYGVLITSINEIRGLSFDYLFIAGLVDGEFPTKFSPEIFYSGSYAKGAGNHQLEERYHFYQSLCAWNKALYLSYSKFEDEKELVESTFIKEISKLFKIRKIDNSEYNKLLYSQEELLRSIGESWKYNKSDEIRAKISDKNFDWNRLLKSLKIDKLRREDPFWETQFNGYIIPDTKSESFPVNYNYKIKQVSLDFINSFLDREYSITQLETYALCPFRYFLTRVLQLEEIKEPSEEIEALELGSLLHNILYEFYVALRKENLVVNQSTDVVFNKAKKKLFDIAEANFENLNFSSPMTFFEREKIFGLNGNSEESILYKFLECERNQDKNSMPSYFEVAFGSIKRSGSDEELSIYNSLKFGAVNLRGKIDRIDIDDNNKLLTIIDYKLGGKKPSIKDLEEGISLQLPVYLYAANEILADKLEVNLRPFGMVIFSLKFQEGKFGRQNITIAGRKKVNTERKVELNKNLIKNSSDKINGYVKDISLGKFNLSTLEDRENKACRYCKFHSICRVQELLN